MAENVINLRGNTLLITKVIAELGVEGATAATEITVEADAENGVTAGTLQAVIEELAARVQALEDAP